MKKEEITALFGKFESISCEVEGIECWSARELQPLLGYAKWDNFINNVVVKAKEACRNAGSPDKPGGLSIQLCKSEKKEFYIRYSS